MSNSFYASPEMKKKYIKKWVASKSEYQQKHKTVQLLYAAALLVWITFIIIFIVISLCNSKSLPSGIAIGAAVGAAFACIPFVIGNAIHHKAFLEYSSPFSSIKRECLCIYDDGVEYLYHNAANKQSVSMDVYRIPAENINAVSYDPEYHIITIIGKGELLAYDNYTEKQIDPINSQRRFFSNSPYDILAAFENEEQALQLLKRIAKRNNGL